MAEHHFAPQKSHNAHAVMGFIVSPRRQGDWQANIPNFPVNHNASVRWRGSTAVHGRPLRRQTFAGRRCPVALEMLGAGGWRAALDSRRQSQAGEKRQHAKWHWEAAWGRTGDGGQIRGRLRLSQALMGSVARGGGRGPMTTLGPFPARLGRARHLAMGVVDDEGDHRLASV
jgi:hypothetical protein